ncbi:MAG: transposase [Polyangiaceae bacterium]
MLAAASVAGTLPAGPALRQKQPIRLRSTTAPEHPKALCASQDGFSLHAATTARAGDAAGREALCKYVLRPPIAQERVQLLGDHLVRLVLKRPFSDGTFALDLDPLALLVRLATTVPPPGFHTIRYAGVLAAASKWRARVVPPPPPSQPPTAHSDDDSSCTTDCATCSEGERQAAHPSVGVPPVA